VRVCFNECAMRVCVFSFIKCVCMSVFSVYVRVICVHKVECVFKYIDIVCM
jgi:hypothetical protein